MKRKRGVEEDGNENWREKELKEKLPSRKRRKKQEKEEEEEDEFDALPQSMEDFIEQNTEEEDEDEDEENLVNKPECGIIEEIIVENFMCHKKLKVEFKSHINVITGKNGSGKSAIVIAIQAVLGGKKPRQAGRIQDLIKEGEEICYIRIILRNKGADGYQTEKFGNKIVVERSISRKGGSSYKVMDADGTTHYRTKKELDLILRYFNIHVANPCVVMSQDVAKTFLTTAKGGEKYDLFLEASQLKGMLEDFNHAKDQRDKMTSSLLVKNKRLDELKKELDEMEDEIKVTETIGQFENDITEIRNNLMWKMVFDVESKIDRAKGRVDEENAGLKEIEGKLKEIDTQIRKIRQEDDAIGKRISEKYDEKRALNEKYNQKREQIRESKSHRTRIESKIVDIETQKKNAKKVIKKRERKMEEIRTRVSKSNEDEVRLLKEQIQKDEVQQKGAHDKAEEAKNGKRRTESVRDQVEEKYEDATAKVKTLVKSIDREKREMNQILNSQKDKLNFFSEGCLHLLQLIQQNRHGFDRQPIGPVWMYLNVREAKWACGIEEYLGRESEHFIVHTPKDARKIKELCQRNRIRRPNVIVYPYVDRPHFIPVHKEVPKQYMTIDRQIKVDLSLAQKRKFKIPRGGHNVVDATVRNYLIDYKYTERVILVEDRRELENVFFNQRPQNAFRGLSRNGTVVEWLNQKRYLESKNITKVRFFGEETDQTEQIDRHKQRILELKREEKPLQDEVKKKRKELNRQRRDYDSYRNREKKMRMLVRKLEKKIKNAKEELSELIEQDEGDDQDKEEELEQQRNKIERIRQDILKMDIKIQMYAKELEGLKPEEQKLKDEIHKLKKVKQDIDVLVNDLSTESREKQKELSMVSSKEQTFRIDQARKNRLIQLLNEKLRSLEASKISVVENAQTQGGEDSRPDDVTESAETLENKIREIERLLKREEAKLDGRTPQSIKEHYNGQISKYHETKAYLEIGEKNLKAIKKGLNQRHKKWKEIRLNYSKVAALAFNRALTQKGHSGKLHFDFMEETLSTEIQLSRTEDRKVKDTKSLSGGEKSFSTLALLTAMWEVAESPFRALDEVDIFMDNLYRKKAMDLIVQVSMHPNHVNSQLIIVTPQSTKGIRTKKNKAHVHIIKMKDPIRDGFRQTSIDEHFHGED